jgi:hypothetical protein
VPKIKIKRQGPFHFYNITTKLYSELIFGKAEGNDLFFVTPKGIC